MLDIMQDYLSYKHYTYERIDGSVRADERWLSIERFTSLKCQVFLLSTRAAGVGLNLIAADTVILYDSSIFIIIKRLESSLGFTSNIKSS